MSKLSKRIASSSSSSTIPPDHTIQVSLTQQGTNDANGIPDGYIHTCRYLDLQGRGARFLEPVRIGQTVLWRSAQEFLFLPDAMYQWAVVGSTPKTLFFLSREAAAFGSINKTLTCRLTGVGTTTFPTNVYYTILTGWDFPLFLQGRIRRRKPGTFAATPAVVRATIRLVG